jgi:hypothetical protein
LIDMEHLKKIIKIILIWIGLVYALGLIMFVRDLLTGPHCHTVIFDGGEVCEKLSLFTYFYLFFVGPLLVLVFSIINTSIYFYERNKTVTSDYNLKSISNSKKVASLIFPTWLVIGILRLFISLGVWVLVLYWLFSSIVLLISFYSLRALSLKKENLGYIFFLILSLFLSIFTIILQFRQLIMKN